MCALVHPVRGEYVTARIPVRDALLKFPDLIKYASPRKENGHARITNS